MNLLRLPAFVIAILIGALPLAAAAEYCVRAGASGAGNGSDWNNAFPVLPTTLQRGATYYIADGAYTGRAFNTPASGTTPITIRKATAVAHGTGTGWMASLGDGQATFSSQIEFDSSYWEFDGQTGGGPGNWAANYGFKITSTDDAAAVLRMGYHAVANHITVRHVDLAGKGSVGSQGGSYGNDGVAIYGCANITAAYLWMHGIGRCPFFIDTADSVFDHLYVQSYFGSAGVHSEVASIWSFSGLDVGNITFSNSLFTHIASTGGLMFDNSSNPASHLFVYGNVFYKPAGAAWEQANGVIGGWTAGGAEMHNVWVYNNSFINVDQQTLSTFPNIASGCQARNNLFYNCDAPDFAKFPAHDHNHFINSGGAQGEADGTAAANGDPFVDFANLDFRLKAATATGASLGTPYAVDPYGIIRGGDGTWDRGAYEHVASGNTAPTIAAIADQTMGVNTGKTVTLTVGDAETAAGSLTVTATSANTTLVSNAHLVVTGTGGTRTLTITPTTGQTGSATITVTVVDGGGLSASDAFVLTVAGDTTAPATPAAPTVSGDGGSAPVLAGTTEAGALVTIRADGVVVATVTAGANGAWTWTVSGLAAGSHAITVSASDAAGNASAASPATTITVGGNGSGSGPSGNGASGGGCGLGSGLAALLALAFAAFPLARGNLLQRHRRAG